MDAALASLTHSLHLVLPELVLSAGACALILGALVWRDRQVWGLTALVWLAAAGVVWWVTRESSVVHPAASPFQLSPLLWLLKGMSLAAGALLVLLSWNQVADDRAAEFHACLLVVVAGLNLVAASNDLVILFLALEFVSIPTYVLLYLPRQDAPAQEAATKYFLLSIFSSAVLLYGLSLLYGCAGATNLEVVRHGLTALPENTWAGLLLVALVLIVAGLGFRITAVPFHFYAPDVFQGTATAGAAFLSLVPKIAGFVALYHIASVVLLTPLPAEAGHSLTSQAMLLWWILAVVSMFLGNILALLQDNLKRLLAYSSVAHAGYMLVGLGALAQRDVLVTGLEALFFYLAVYGVMTLGAFAVVVYLSRPGRSVETVDDLSGLVRSHPAAALCLAVCVFSLTGLPPTAGFWGKFNLFLAAWGVPGSLFKWLAVLLAVNASIAAWYYLRIVGVMFLRQPIKPLARSPDLPALASGLVCAGLTLGLFFAPHWLWKEVEKAVRGDAAAARADR